MSDPLRVVVLGGGMGGLSAAFELSKQPEKYCVRVYEKDWCLGGKGASGRCQSPGYGRRVQEHGLHILMGFYDHAFHVLEQCYGEVAKSPNADKILGFGEAFTPWDTATFADPRRDGSWGLWRVWLPPNHKRIGGPPAPADARELFHAGRAWLRRFHRDFHHSLHEPMGRRLGRLLGEVAAWLHRALVASPFGRLRWTLPLQEWLLRPVRRDLELRFERAWALASAHDLVEPGSGLEGEALSAGDLARHLLIALWLGTANLVGMIRDRVVFPPHDFTRIDGVDYRDWLEQQLPIKPPPPMGRDSPPLSALYDLAFSHGHTLAAGTTLRVVLRMGLDYRGHLAYRMNGGMGDVVFAPLYYALCERQVPIEFFTEVIAIEPNAAGDAIEKIVLRRLLATPKGWDPLEPIPIPGGRTQYCWPAGPQGVGDPSPLEFTLCAGRDFDVAVLGIPIAALPALFPPDIDRINPAFAKMLEKVRTVATQSIQLWLGPKLRETGWKKGSAMLISFTRPFNSWVDMFQVLPYEPWPPPAPKTLAYFADVLEDAEPTGGDPEQVVKQNALRFLSGPVRQIWPDFDWSQLCDPEGRSGPARLDAQYLRANVAPSQRYTLAEAGARRHRLPAGGSGFRNLALAGDWVRTELSAGALEAATLGGLDAARAIREGRVHG